jgi:riboflavin synthase
MLFVCSSVSCRVTVLGSKGEDDLVNIEVEAQTQAIVDTVEKVVARYLSEGKLAAASPATPDAKS